MIFGGLSPEIVHVEITKACNFRCRHCYNFYRFEGKGESYNPREISWENLNNTIRELVENNVRHVIITGGEPLLALKKTCHLAMQSVRWGMTNSLNSNLSLATPETVGMLKDAGVQHCLTTLNASTIKMIDWIASTKGALNQIAQGIKNMQGEIRVTANLILNEHNKDDVYATGLLASAMGIKKFLANRCIPSAGSDYIVSKEEAQRMFDDLLLLQDIKMEVQTCRMVPECFFDDLERYKPFINRGCSAGRKHLLLNVDGESHACVHESKSYGNIHEIGLKGIWENMREWRTDEYTPKECLDCERLESCMGGCRMVALAHTGKMNGQDNLQRRVK